MSVLHFDNYLYAKYDELDRCKLYIWFSCEFRNIFNECVKKSL